ncbi:hypothetical protein HA402_014894 [Bradysia odoriphaga]|nr:hypothetical protein HA402_014894 [Bradysia odoriphaga]
MVRIKVYGYVFLRRTPRRPSENIVLNFIFYTGKDPGPKFTDTETQKLLKSITRPQLSKIFRKQPREVNVVDHKMMTTEQIEEQLKASIEKAEHLLQMPPIVKVKLKYFLCTFGRMFKFTLPIQIQQEYTKVISKDPGIDSFSPSKYVITDITYGVDDADRMIVVRQVDGTLEYADAAIRKRINQIYFPQQGRKIRLPRMFEPDNLKRCLDRHAYEFVLDRTCIQFEPYEQEFHDISSQVFQHINNTKQFDILRSTRHFGPMSFFLAWHKLIDDLVIEMVERDFLQNAVELICLMYNLNDIQYDKAILDQFGRSNTLKNVDAFSIAKAGLVQDLNETVGKSAEQFKTDEICFKFIDNFCQLHGIKKSQISLCLQLYKDSNEEKKRLLEGLKKAHGIVS